MKIQLEWWHIHDPTHGRQGMHEDVNHARHSLGVGKHLLEQSVHRVIGQFASLFGSVRERIDLADVVEVHESELNISGLRCLPFPATGDECSRRLQCCLF